MYPGLDVVGECSQAHVVDRAALRPGQLLVLLVRLADLGTDKTRILSATVILGDIENKPMADKVWADWMGDNPDHWPERSCHGVDLHAGNAIEIRVVAVRDDPED